MAGDPGEDTDTPGAVGATVAGAVGADLAACSTTRGTRASAGLTRGHLTGSVHRRRARRVRAARRRQTEARYRQLAPVEPEHSAAKAGRTRGCPVTSGEAGGRPRNRATGTR